MRHYETIYIVNPELSDDDYSKEIEKFSSLIKNQKGVIIKTQEWGKQKLAYLINKFDRGTYVLVEYCADAGVSAELEKGLKLDDKILKYQTVKLADKADVEELVAKEKEKEAAMKAEKAPAPAEETAAAMKAEKAPAPAEETAAATKAEEAPAEEKEAAMKAEEAPAPAEETEKNEEPQDENVEAKSEVNDGVSE